MPAESTPLRRVRRLLSLAAAGAVCAAVGLVGAVVPPGSAAAASAAVGGVSGVSGVSAASGSSIRTTEGVRLSVAPAASSAVPAGQPVEVVVEIVNGTDAAIPAGTLTLAVAAEPIDDAAAVDAWTVPLQTEPDPVANAENEADADADPDADVNGESPAAPVDLEVVAERATASLAAGAVTSLTLTVPAEATDAGDPLIGLSAELAADGQLVAATATVVANSLVPVAVPAGLALAYPLTVPAQSSGVIAADRLESWTGPTGLLTRQLDSVAGRPVAVGIDPRIPASIRVLGSSAPESAVAWLADLEAMPNEVFPLAYADADLAAQAQVGLEASLEPVGFDDVLDPADFTGGSDGAGEPDEPGEDGETPAPVEVPSESDLLEWDFTRTDIAWPADGTVADGDLDMFAAGGLTTAILARVNAETPGSPVNAAATIDGRAAVVADARVTSALRAAAGAASDAQWQMAAARLLAELTLATDGGAEPVTLLGTFARSAGVEADRVAATLATLSGGQWARSATLAEAVGAPPAARTLVPLPEDAQRLENVDRLLRAEQSVDEFSDVLADPTVLTAPTRRDLLALLDVGWLGQPDQWTEAVGTWLVDRRAVTDAVSIVPSSSVLVVATETGIPITVQNALPYAVEVEVEVAPSNGRLIVEDTVEAVVEAESRSTVQVPVAAGVGSGEVTLVVSMTSPDGTPIGANVRVPANVQADWEGVGAAVIAAIVVTVFGVGVIRAFRRRGRERAPDETSALPDTVEERPHE